MVMGARLALMDFMTDLRMIMRQLPVLLMIHRKKRPAQIDFACENDKCEAGDS
jgi:hypothetical protein